MITPTIKAIDCPSIPDLDDYVPDNASFCIPLEVSIGDQHGEGADLFYLNVASLDYVVEKVSKSSGMFGRGYLIVRTFDYRQIRDTLERYCRRVASETWDEVAAKLNRLMGWEFEDYKG